MVGSGAPAPSRSAAPLGGGRRLAAREVEPFIERQAARHGLDPRLVQAVIRAESDYDRWALSVKGAAGLMQLMPETARAYAVDDPYDPEANIAAGTAYLKRLVDEFDGSLELALAAYNAGAEAVRRYGGIPPYGETLAYVSRVLSNYRPGVPANLATPYSGGRPTEASGSRSIHLYRDAMGRLVMTTSPPGRH
jgi:soluble lytic murein transglycosylase-like protein